MLSCKEVTIQASDYLDGDLPLLRRLSFRLHLAGCRLCRRFLSDLTEGDRLVRCQGQADCTPSPDFIAGVQSGISRRLWEEAHTATLETTAAACNEPVIEGVEQPVDERVQRIFSEVREKEGFVPNLFKAYAHQPDVLEYNWSREKSLLYSGVLESAFKSAVILVLSTDNRCHYCIHHHRIKLERFGRAGADIDQLISDPEESYLNSREKALMAMVRRANRDPHQPADALLARARSEGASDAEIIEAMSVMELYSSWNKFLDFMRIQIESEVV